MFFQSSIFNDFWSQMAPKRHSKWTPKRHKFDLKIDKKHAHVFDAILKVILSIFGVKMEWILDESRTELKLQHKKADPLNVPQIPMKINGFGRARA